MTPPFFRTFSAARAVLAAALFLAGLLSPHAALAQVMSLGDVMCQASQEIIPFAYLFNGISYIAGAILIGAGLVYFVRHQHNPQETKLHTPILHVVAGAGLLFLPSTITLIVNSLFGYPGAGGVAVCAGIEPVGSGGGVTLATMMSNLIYNIKDPMVFLLSTIAIVIGVFLIMRGLMKAAKYGLDPRANSVQSVLAHLIIGAILIVVGQSLSVMLSSLFGVGTVADSSIISWSILNNFGPNTQQFQTAIYAALTFFQLIGMIAFIRGWLILKDSVEGKGQATFAQGMTHIIGGVCAINIYYILVVFDNTFGTGFLSG
jgi:hypothetical protein